MKPVDQNKDYTCEECNKEHQAPFIHCSNCGNKNKYLYRQLIKSRWSFTGGILLCILSYIFFINVASLHLKDTMLGSYTAPTLFLTGLLLVGISINLYLHFIREEMQDIEDVLL